MNGFAAFFDRLGDQKRRRAIVFTRETIKSFNNEWDIPDFSLLSTAKQVVFSVFLDTRGHV